MKVWPVVQRKEIAWVGVYSFAGASCTAVYFIAVTFIPLATEESIYHTTQLFGGLVTFWILLRERPTVERIAAVILCAGGVILVVQPDIIFKTKFVHIGNHTSMPVSLQKGSTRENYTIFGLGCGLALTAGVLQIVRFTTIKFHSKLFSDTEKQPVILFWNCLIGAVLCVSVSLCFEKPVLPENGKDYLLVMGHVLSYMFAPAGYLYAAPLLDGNTVNILYTTTIIYMVIAQYTVLKYIQPGHRNWIEVVGIVLVVIGCVLSPVVTLLKKWYNKG